MKENILFINFGGLGDEILFLPSILSVKKEFPESVVTLALEKRSAGIITLTNAIDNTLFVDIKGKFKYYELLKLLFEIWTKNFDMVISSGSNKFISVFLFLTFIKKRYGYNTGKLSEKLLTKAVTLNKNQYAAKMYHDLVRDITDYDTELPQILVEKQPTVENSVVIHPGVSKMSIKKGIIKTVSADIWAETVEKLADRGKKVILLGGSDDKDVIEKIVEKVPSDKFSNMYEKTQSLKELAEIISSAEIFLCSDSAPLHIASALGVKTYAIFGSTDDKKLVPENGSIISIKNNCDCPIKPCLWDKRQTTCDSLDCLKMTSDEIVEKICDKMSEK